MFTSPFGGECSASRDYIFPSPSIYAKEIDCCSYDENRSDEENARYLATCTPDESTGKITFAPPEGSPSDPSVCVQEGTSTNYLDKEGEIVYTEPGAPTSTESNAVCCAAYNSEDFTTLALRNACDEEVDVEDGTYMVHYV